MVKPLNHTCVLYSKGYEIEVLRKLLKPYIDNRIDIIVIGSKSLKYTIQNNITTNSPTKIKYIGNEEIYGLPGEFDKEYSLERIKNITNTDQDEFFLVVGQIPHQSPERWDELLEYEFEANRILRSMNCTAICLYILEDLSFEFQSKLIDYHPYLMINGKKMKNINFGKKKEEIITICMYCKRVKQEDDIWEINEGTLLPIEEATFSHGICPQCLSEDKFTSTA